MRMDPKSWRAIFTSLCVCLIINNGLANISNFKCDFEAGDCGFSKYLQGDLDWVWGAASTGVGPGVDSTLGTSTGHYLYLDTMTSSTSLIARTGSQFFATTTAVMCAEVYVFSSSWSTITLTGFAIAPELKSFMDLGRFGGSREGVWKKALLEIPPQRLTFQLIFVAQVTGSSNGFILAIDDIRISEGPCPSLETFECTFEDQNICGFTHDTTATFDFIRQNEGTPTPATGPTMDHTLNNANGYYMRIEANKKTQGSSARLISPAIQGTRSFHEPSCLLFWYHMYGKHMGYLNVYAMTTDINPSTTTLSEATMVWTLKGDQGDTWKMAEIGIDMANEFVIIFEALRGDGNKGDVAIDDVQFLHSVDCPVLEISTPLTKDRTTQSPEPTTKEKPTTHQIASTVSSSESVLPTTLLDKTTVKMSTFSTFSKVDGPRSVSLRASRGHTTLTEPTTPTDAKVTSSESVQSAALSERTSIVRSTSEVPTTVPTVLRSASLSSNTPHEHTTLIEPTTFPAVWKDNTLESRSAASSKHTTLMASMVSSTDHPTISRISSPELVSPTTLDKRTTPTEAWSLPTISELNTAESAGSIASSEQMTYMAPTSIHISTYIPRESMNNSPGSGRSTTSHELTTPIESTTLVAASKISTIESEWSAASSVETVHMPSTSIQSSIAFETETEMNSPESDISRIPHEFLTPAEPTTLPNVSLINTPELMPSTLSPDETSVKNTFTVTTGTGLPKSKVGSTGSRPHSEPIYANTSPQHDSEETQSTVVSTSILNTTLLPFNSSTDYILSVNLTIHDLTIASIAKDRTEAPTQPQVSKKQSSATPTEEVSEGPIGDGSFLENNKLLMISLAVVLGGICIGATVALISRFMKPSITARPLKHRGHNRVGAVEVAMAKSTHPSQNAWMMSGKTSGLPSIESMERQNIYHS